MNVLTPPPARGTDSDRNREIRYTHKTDIQRQREGGREGERKRGRGREREGETDRQTEVGGRQKERVTCLITHL